MNCQVELFSYSNVVPATAARIAHHCRNIVGVSERHRHTADCELHWVGPSKWNKSRLRCAIDSTRQWSQVSDDKEVCHHRISSTERL